MPAAARVPVDELFMVAFDFFFCQLHVCRHGFTGICAAAAFTVVCVVVQEPPTHAHARHATLAPGWRTDPEPHAHAHPTPPRPHTLLMWTRAPAPRATLCCQQEAFS